MTKREVWLISHRDAGGYGVGWMMVKYKYLVNRFG